MDHFGFWPVIFVTKRVVQVIVVFAGQFYGMLAAAEKETEDPNQFREADG